MIRSSKHTLKYTNKNKQQQLSVFFTEYRRLLSLIINDLWNNKLPEFNLDIQNNKLNCPSLLPNDYLKNIHSWFTARMKQCVGKQACSMIKAAIQKRKKQLYQLKKLQKENKNTSFLQRKIDTRPLIMPNAERAQIDLDPRFVDIQEGKHFDLFIYIKTIGNKMEFRIPIKHTVISRKWMKQGTLKNSIRLISGKENSLCLIFDIPDKPKKETGNILGADQGQLTVLSLSDKQTTSKDKDGYNLDIIQEKLARRQKGSKRFKKAQEHRKNHINWSLNQLNFFKTKEVRLEKIKQIRSKKKTGRKMTHWSYTLIRDKLISLSETKGFCFKEVNNEFRSQRCSSCGWVRKSNRKGKTFNCDLCSFTTDSDLNAASNLSIDLFEIPFWVRSKKINRQGFYWNHDGLFSKSHEPIVHDALKTCME